MTNNLENIDLSVIIVNYNVEYFLEQCLNSVFQATKDLKIEVFVVDNNSIDGSVKMIKERFQSVHLIENKTNNGFSKANNQAIKIADNAVTQAKMADDSVGSSEMKSLSTLLIINSAGTTVKTLHGAGA